MPRIRRFMLPAAAGILALGAGAFALDDDLVVALAEDPVPSLTQLQCGADCGSGWQYLFTCDALNARECCGWYNCTLHQTYGGCCGGDKVCDWANSPYPTWSCKVGGT